MFTLGREVPEVLAYHEDDGFILNVSHAVARGLTVASVVFGPEVNGHDLSVLAHTSVPALIWAVNSILV
jgi:hypothetical protein